jgi:bifunctional DNA-binding transcriptional regulator/antitoxin component of YhaV-PrlF toxin-antitoxin module
MGGASMSPKANTKAEVIARATVYQDGEMVRGKIPVPVVKALKAKDGDVLTFATQADGSVVVRKATAAERKPATGKAGTTASKKGRKMR